jgi:diguanylate cyclase (GGDEF)-like protein
MGTGVAAVTTWTPVIDPALVAFRRRGVAVASTVTLLVVGLVLLYVALTPREPNRAAIAALALLAACAPALIAATRAWRLVGTRWSDLFFGLWSTTYVVVITAWAVLDGGARSPFCLVFVLTLAFAGLWYPVWLGAVIAGVDVAGYLVVGLLAPAAPLAEGLLFVAVLLLTAGMCAFQGRIHLRDRLELARLSRTDPLTGALNRRGLEERLEAELGRGRRDGWAGGEVSVVLIDLDRFKEVNDTQGHEAGDLLLRHVVERGSRVLRSADAIGRTGGDEFAVLLPATGAAAGREVTLRLRAALGEEAPASYGIGSAPQDGETAEDLLRAADAALYREKERGRRLVRDPAELSPPPRR